MIRHAALVPLSHDHHLGLMAAQRLRRGDAAYKEAELAESVDRLWRTELAEHFDHEERYLFPLAATPELQALCARAIDEHVRMRALVKRIADGQDVPANARELGEILLSHIRFEERELFEAMQASVAPESLAAAGVEMQKHRSPRACSSDSQGD